MKNKPIDISSLQGMHETIQRLIKAQEEKDFKTQRDILTQLIKYEQDDYQRKLRLLTELKTLTQEADAAKDTEERIRRLIAVFRFSADLREIGYDDLDDKETGDRATDTAIEVCRELKAAVPDGLAALVDLLNDDSINVRSFAAVQLLREVPERAIPVIEEVQRVAPGSDASFSAGFALRRYRSAMERKS